MTKGGSTNKIKQIWYEWVIASFRLLEVAAWSGSFDAISAPPKKQKAEHPRSDFCLPSDL